MPQNNSVELDTLEYSLAGHKLATSIIVYESSEKELAEV